MYHIKSWMTLEMALYYSLIFAAIIYLLIEFLKPKENGQFFKQFMPNSKDCDHMDG